MPNLEGPLVPSFSSDRGFTLAESSSGGVPQELTNPFPPASINLTSLSHRPILKHLKGWCSASENSQAPALGFLPA